MMASRLTETHIRENVRSLHGSLLDIVGVMMAPERDEVMLQKAGLKLERALFPLLVLIERLGPIGVVELASRVGRDYTTVSRQLARLEELDLVERRPGGSDKRVREAIVTPKGKAATDALDIAREQGAIDLFRGWDKSAFDDLVVLLRKMADGMVELPA